MQPPQPPMTPYEEHITQAYQLLGSARVRSAFSFSSVHFCIDRCLDTEELYTLLRTTHAPISHRLHRDVEEKKCVQNCGIKWYSLFQTALTETNMQAVDKVQADAMAHAMQMMRQ
ncbi:hypothetical protein NESM_000391600 [Novymonas esmeraldas]|uniref:Uncharacterized protein n=1 Tax=Novymonas esmeraldas TaxID=1808958 RepID=A0AAW0EP59_9TRYP